MKTFKTLKRGTENKTPDRPDVKIKNHGLGGLGQYGAEPHYSTYYFGNFGLKWSASGQVTRVEDPLVTDDRPSSIRPRNGAFFCNLIVFNHQQVAER